MYDIAAYVDYILEKTNKPKLYYVGHSQGGTIFYVLNSMRPEYQKKFILASLLAPAGYFNNFANPFLTPIVKAFGRSTQEIAAYYSEYPPENLRISESITSICMMKSFENICFFIYNLVMGKYSGEIPKYMIPIFGKYIPNVSSKQILHFAQLILSGYFRLWDYRIDGNVEKYGNEIPPDYPVQDIKVPVALYYSISDTIVYAKDIIKMCEKLGNCVKLEQVNQPNFTHLDFIFAINLKKLISDPLIQFARNYDDEKE